MELKPIFELLNDELACESILKMCFEESCFHFCREEQGYVVIQGSCKTLRYDGPGRSSSTTALYIGKTGQLFVTQMGEFVDDSVNFFTIVDAIRQLGYSA